MLRVIGYRGGARAAVVKGIGISAEQLKTRTPNRRDRYIRNTPYTHHGVVSLPDTPPPSSASLQSHFSSASGRSQRPIRVLLMAGAMDAGGSERQTLLLLRHLDRSLFQPLLFLRHARGPWLQEVPQDVKVLAYDTAEDGKAETLGQSLRFNWPGRQLQRQTKFLTDCLLNERIDVIYDRTFHMTLLAGPASEQTGIPRVSTIVNLPEHAFPLLEKKFRWWKKRRLKRAYCRAAQVVAVSQAVARSAETFYGLAAGSVMTIPNPLDLAPLRVAAKQPVPWRPIESRVNIVCVGRMDGQKGHVDLLDALAGLPKQEWHLWLLGDGVLRPVLEQRVRHLEMTDRVTFLGHVDNVPAIVSQCQLLVLPSRFEGMPNAVLEAMALAVPVIATDAGGTPELLQEGKLGTIVPPANPPVLRQAIEHFLRDPQPAIARAQAAKSAVIREHSVGKAVGQIEAVLRKAANGIRRH